MNFYIQYHNVGREGLPLSDPPFSATQLSIHTRRSEVRKAVGTVFLIAGMGKPRRYFLWQAFEIEEVKEDEDGLFLASGTGWELAPPVELKGNRFEEFKSACATFTSFRCVNDQPFTRTLRKLAEESRPPGDPKKLVRFLKSVDGLLPANDPDHSTIQTALGHYEAERASSIEQPLAEATKSTYLLTWNPENSEWPELREQAKSTQNGISVCAGWSCGNTKRLKSGDRLFLLKQGPELPKGIMASGVAISDVYEEEHWDEARAKGGETTLFVDAEWEVILDPAQEHLLPVSELEIDALPTVHWRTQRSGIVIPTSVAQLMDKLWKRHVEAERSRGTHESTLVIDPDEDEFPEGRVKYSLHRTYERNPELVKLAKKVALKRDGKLSCEVCKFDFFKTYGSVGEHFIECHHTIPVSEMEGTTTKIGDLVLVCSNCHRMLHRKRPWLGHHELLNLLATESEK